MITARNIAASAERGMIELGKIFHKADPKHKDIQTCKALASVISKATHFVIPDGGRILNDSKRGIVGRQLCLPYPLITVEYMKKLGVDNRDTKCLLVADQPTEDDNITLWGCFKYPDSIWTPSLLYTVVERDWSSIKEGIEVRYPRGYDGSRGVTALLERTGTLLQQAVEQVKGMEEVENRGDILFDQVCTFVGPLLEFLEALSCRNVTTATYQKEATNNQQKIKKGKLPVYETKVLVIDPVGKRYNKTDGTESTHSSPRQHLRRGHIRRLRSGNIWVNSCVVGSSEKGKIDKIYALRR